MKTLEYPNIYSYSAPFLNTVGVKLIIKFDLDADFRNGSGESLMQTASQFENKVVIDKLKPLASKVSYHPPKKLIELEQVNLKIDVLNELSEGLAKKTLN